MKVDADSPQTLNTAREAAGHYNETSRITRGIGMESGGRFLMLPSGQSVDMSIWLYDFSINGFQLRAGHLDALKNYVFPVLVAGGSATIVGMASRTGSKQHNLQLSRRRANSASRQLIAYVGPVENRLRTVSGVGEAAATIGLMADDTESDLYRAVAISVWSKAVPPPPPPPPPRKSSGQRHRCKTGASDPNLIDRINNQDKWLVAGASGDHGQLQRFIKGFELQMSSPPTSGEKRLLDFYRTNIFRDWYIGGTCSVVSKYPMEQVSRNLLTFLTEKGRKNHGLSIELITKQLYSLGPS